MNRPYVERLQVKHYGCVQDCTLMLSPLHALVGPNDSGKSTLLTALLTMGQWAMRFDGAEEIAARDRLTDRFLRAGEGASFGIQSAGSDWTRLHNGEDSVVESLPGSHGATQLPRGSRIVSGVFGLNVGRKEYDVLRSAISGVRLLRLDPDALRQPSGLIPEGRPIELLDARGKGLPSVLDAIQTRSLESIAELNAQMRSLFPTFKSLRLRNTSGHEKALGALLTNGIEVSADEMSEGMLYYLALATLEHLDPVPLLLIEEPENGLHPARIQEVMRLFRKLSERTQIVMATHSPLVANELEGHEISVVTRPPATGTQAIRLCDTPGYELRAKAYSNGELWLSYSDGVQESPLLDPLPSP